jgi:hypothetical protein
MERDHEAQAGPTARVCYGVIREKCWRTWDSWPAEIFYATVSSDADTFVGRLVVAPPKEWLKHRKVTANLTAEQERLLSTALDPAGAAMQLNRAFGDIPVISSDGKSNVWALFKWAGVRRSWSLADPVAPFRQFDVRVGEHAVLRMMDLVPLALQGEDRVRAHARAYLDLCRARAVLGQTLAPPDA